MFLLMMLLSFFDAVNYVSIFLAILADLGLGYCVILKRKFMIAPVMYLFGAFYFCYGLTILYNPLHMNQFGEGAKYFLVAILFFTGTAAVQKMGAKRVLYCIDYELILIALISMESATTKVFSELLFERVLNRLGCEYQLETMAYEGGQRLVGIWGNGNLLAGMMAIAILISLYLYVKDQSKRSLIMLFYALLTFWLSMSRSMIIAGVLAVFVAYILLRTELQLVHIMRAILWTILSIAGQMVVERFIYAQSILMQCVTLLVFMVLPFVIYGVDFSVLHFTKKWNSAFTVKKKYVFIIAGLGVLVAVLAIVWKQPIRIHAGEDIVRELSLTGGSYECKIEKNGTVYMRLTARSRAEELLDRNTELYAGEVQSGSMTVLVPDGTQSVKVEIAGDGTVREVSFAKGDDKKQIGLDRVLFPNSFENRMQGVLIDKNVLQRILYFEDAVKVWRKSPIWGNGVGSFAVLERSVQDVFYEVKYVHNQPLQLLVDFGLIGLLLFGLCIFLFAKKLWISTTDDKALRVFGVSFLVLSLGHGLADVEWNTCANLLLYVLMFQVITVLIADAKAMESSLLTAAKGERGKGYYLTAFACINVILILVTLHLTSERTLEKMVAGEIPFSEEKLLLLAQKDPICRDEYLLYAIQYEAQNELLHPNMISEIRELSARKQYEINKALIMDYYLAYGECEKAFDVCLDSMNMVRSDVEAWDSVIEIFRNYDVLFYHDSGLTDIYQNGKEKLAEAYNKAKEEVSMVRDISAENENWLFSLK